MIATVSQIGKFEWGMPYRSKSKQLAESELLGLDGADPMHNAKGFVLGQIIGGELHLDDVVMSPEELAIRIDEMTDAEREIMVPIAFEISVPVFTAYGAVVNEYNRRKVVV